MPEVNDRSLVCRYCGQAHRGVALVPGEHADCVRCGSVIARGRAGVDGALAWGLAGFFLAIPTLFLPLATVDRLGLVHEGPWFSGVRALWLGSMPELAVGVLILGWVAPVGLLALLITVALALRRAGEVPPGLLPLARVAGFFERWAMPEVYLLAVLVAFIKLGTLVNVTIGPGLWCYAGAAVAMVKASRSFDWAAVLPEKP